MASTTRDIIERIRDLVHDPVDGYKYRDEVYVRSALNPTLRELEALTLVRPVSATLYSVAGQAAYAIPTSLGAVHYVIRVSYGADAEALAFIDHYDAVDEARAGAGTPRAWRQVGGTLELTPPPAADSAPVVVTAYCSPVAATSAAPATDELQLALDVEDALIYGAAAKLCIIDSEPARAEQYEAIYKRRLKLIHERRTPDRGDLNSVRDLSGIDQQYFW